MTRVSIIGGFLATLIIMFACKQQGESALTSSSGSARQPETHSCVLLPSQTKLLLSAGEFSSLEKVSIDTLPADEKTALKEIQTQKNCTNDDLGTLSDAFPSIAAQLTNKQQDTSGNNALALGGDMMGGATGVIRTDYILIPRTGTRYLAGYNSDGIIVLLQRLMQTRPR